MDAEKLIDCTRRRPVLYECSRKFYKDSTKKNNRGLKSRKNWRKTWKVCTALFSHESSVSRLSSREPCFLWSYLTCFLFVHEFVRQRSRDTDLQFLTSRGLSMCWTPISPQSRVQRTIFVNEMLHFYLNMHQNAFGGRALRGPAGEAYGAPQTQGRINHP